MKKSTIMWFRQDLRLADNQALSYASETGTVFPVYILDETDRPIGGASKWWLHRSLQQLRKKLPTLMVLSGNPIELIQRLVSQVQASSVVWNRVYEPHAISRDKQIKTCLLDQGYQARSFPGSYLQEPWKLKTGAGGPYKVFTPFWKTLSAMEIEPPLNSVETIGLADFEVSEIEHSFNPNWAKRWKNMWSPGETGAMQALEHFLAEGLKGYGELRNRPDLPNVSRLSPHLHFGEISPRQIWARVNFLTNQKPELEGDANKFLSELAWREFSNHLLFHFPSLVDENWKQNFDHYPWRKNADELTDWQNGNTGYPLVDAGMRELWATGYMHNRVRMVAASFLVKHLQIHWKEGEKWFWDTLVDADLANNCASWQWVAGSGADAAPYFRIFNPVTQGEKFDPNGDYVRKWCPELAALPNKYLNRPFEAPAEMLQSAKIKLGDTYPLPIVEHRLARHSALEGYEQVKQSG